MNEAAAEFQGRKKSDGSLRSKKNSKRKKPTLKVGLDKYIYINL
jgi:hypothetical protein